MHFPRKFYDRLKFRGMGQLPPASLSRRLCQQSMNHFLYAASLGFSWQRWTFRVQLGRIRDFRLRPWCLVVWWLPPWPWHVIFIYIFYTEYNKPMYNVTHAEQCHSMKSRTDRFTQFYGIRWDVSFEQKAYRPTEWVSESFTSHSTHNRSFRIAGNHLH